MVLFSIVSILFATYGIGVILAFLLTAVFNSVESLHEMRAATLFRFFMLSFLLSILVFKFCVSFPLRNRILSEFSDTVSFQMNRRDVPSNDKRSNPDRLSCRQALLLEPFATSETSIIPENFTAELCFRGEERYVRFAFPSATISKMETVTTKIGDGELVVLRRLLEGGLESGVHSVDFNLKNVSFTVAEVEGFSPLDRRLAEWAFGGPLPRQLLFIRYSDERGAPSCVAVDFATARKLVTYLEDCGDAPCRDDQALLRGAEDCCLF